MHMVLLYFNQPVNSLNKYHTFVLASQAKGMKRFKEERAAAAAGNHGDGGDPKHPPKKPKTSKSSTKGKAEGTTESSTPGMFHTYDLRKLGIPEIAWPQASRVHLGKHGYTVVSNSAAICQLFAHFLFFDTGTFIFLKQVCTVLFENCALLKNHQKYHSNSLHFFLLTCSKMHIPAHPPISALSFDS